MADLYEQIERLDEENERLYKDLEAAQQALKDITGDARGLEAKAALVEELVAALKSIAQKEEKSMLADCAYQGLPPKKWLREITPRYEGYNECLHECKAMAKAAIAKAEAVLSTPCGKPSS